MKIKKEKSSDLDKARLKRPTTTTTTKNTHESQSIVLFWRCRTLLQNQLELKIYACLLRNPIRERFVCTCVCVKTRSGTR